MTTIGFVGVGNMGLPMSANLVKAGHTVRAYDVVPENVKQAEEAGCVATGSIVEACDGAEAVISIVPEGDHVRAVYLDEGGVLDSAAPDTLLIDMSTIDLATVHAVQGAATARGFEMLDAPVSRGTKGAREGTLVIIAGATDGGFARAKPYFDVLGTDIFHTGAPGTGCATKICNNMMMGINFICAAEGLMLAEHIGLDVDKFFEIVSKSSGANWPLVGYGMLPGMVGTIQATETVKLILGVGESLSGRLLLIDALEMDFRAVKMRRNPDCPLCGDNPTVTELIDYVAFCGGAPLTG